MFKTFKTLIELGKFGRKLEKSMKEMSTATYNNLIYTEDFSECIGMKKRIKDDILSFHPDTEKIDTKVFTNIPIKKVDLTNTKVKAIGPQIFNNQIEEISFPDTLSHIKDESFIGSNLKELNIENTLLDFISYRSFKECINLENVSFPKYLEEIEQEAFKDCTKLKKVDFSDTMLHTVNTKAFENCENLREVLFPEKLFRINAFAFKNTSLSKIDLKNAKFIDLSAFLNTNIDCIHLPEDVGVLSFTKPEEEVIKKLNVSYNGNNKEVLEKLKKYEEDGLVNVIK